MTRRNLFQVLAGAVGALFFPRTAASAPLPVATASAEELAVLTAPLASVGMEDDLYDWYAMVGRELGVAAARQRDAEIFGLLNQPQPTLGHPVRIEGWHYSDE